MRQFLWCSIVALATVTGIVGCGGAPAEETAAPMTDVEMEQNQAMGTVPNDG